jgi:hypothetical protein
MNADKKVKLVVVETQKIMGNLPGNKVDVFTRYYSENWCCPDLVNREIDEKPGNGNIFVGLPGQECMVEDKHGRIRELCKHFEGKWEPLYENPEEEPESKLIQCSCQSEVTSRQLNDYRWSLYNVTVDTF